MRECAIFSIPERHLEHDHGGYHDVDGDVDVNFDVHVDVDVDVDVGVGDGVDGVSKVDLC